MRERPILFSGPMVRAILAGTKTQTRRVLKVQPPASTVTVDLWHHPDPRPHFWACDGGSLLDWAYPCPYGQPGDRLWVREAWQHANYPLGPYRDGCPVYYRADYLDDPHGPDGERSPEGKYRTWRPSIHMPRAACRIVLEVTRVRVERLQAINEMDARAEGLSIAPGGWWTGGDGHTAPTPYSAYAYLWESINGSGAWASNPWVWVVEFRQVTP